MPARIDPGWRTVGGVLLLLTATSGFGFYSLSVYLHALTGEGGFALSSVSWATSLYFLTSGLSGVVVASLLRRLDARLVMVGGAVTVAAALLLIGRVGTPHQLLAVYVLLGAGQSAAGTVPGTTLVARWFVVRRSTALAVATTGLSVGGVAVAPVVGALVERYALRDLTPVLAAVYLVLVLAAACTVVPDPARLGLAPDGRPASPGGRPDGLALAEAVRTRAFWAISGTQALAVLAQVGGLTHLYALGSERVSSSVAGTAVSLAALGSLAGRFVGGAVLRRLPLHAFSRLLLGVQAVALALLAVAGSTPALLASALLFGLTVGNVLLVQPLLVAEVFGLRDFARVLARSALVSTVGITCGPLLVGLLRDATGDYRSSYLVVAAVSLTSGLLRQRSVAHLSAPAVVLTDR